MGLVDLLLVAMMPVIETLLITSVGFYLALDRVDILSSSARHHLNNLVFFVFTPALVAASLANTTTYCSIVSLWFMPVNILLTFMIGSALGWILVKITRTPKHLSNLVISFCAAGNLGNLPLVIIPAVCQEKNSPFGDSSICSSKGKAYVALSLAIGSFFMWTYVFAINHGCGNIGSTRGDGDMNKNSDHTTLGVDCPNSRTSETLSNSCTEALLSKKSTANYEDYELATSAEFCPPENYDLKVPMLEKIGVNVKIIAGKLNLKALFNQITISMIVGLLIGVIYPVKRLIIGDSAPLRVINSSASMLGDATVPSMTLITGANLLKGLRISGVGLWLILGILVARNIALPLFGVFVVKAARHYGLVGSDSLYHFVLLLQFAVPPAPSLSTVTQLFGVNESECSVIMLWTYAVATVSLTFWSTFYIWLVS